MNFTRKRPKGATTTPKTAIAHQMLQAKTAVLQEGTYTGSLSEWMQEAGQALNGAYHTTETPSDYLEAWAKAEDLILTMDGDTLTVTGMEPFTPKVKPPVWIQPGLFEE